MRSQDRVTLEDFALKGMHLAKMTGISVAVHAIPDAFLLMHSGVGCKYKTAAQIANHDWGAHPNRREAWTQVAEVQLIQGCGARIGPFTRTWYERRRPAYMAVVSAYFIELTGEDFTDAVEEAARTVPCDMSLVKTAAPNGGFFDGYATILLEVASKMDWKAPPEHPKQAAILGWFFSRYEPDQQGDLSMLRQLTKVGGLEAGPILFSGRPYAELQEASKAAWVLQLPYARPKARAFKRLLKKRDVIELDLPMGLTPTRRFVKTLAERTGGDVDRVVRWADAQAAHVRDQLDKVRSHLRNLGVAIFADTPWAAGLITIMSDLGVPVRLVGLRDSGGSLGGKAELFELLARNGVEALDDMEIVQEPSLRWIKQTCVEQIRRGRLRGVIASSHELNLFEHEPRIMALSMNTFFLETGFPSDNHHAAIATPNLGYPGLVAWAQRILDAANAPRLGARSDMT